MDIARLIQRNLFEFPRVGVEITYISGPNGELLNDGQDTFRLDWRDVLSVLKAYSKAPEKHANDHDVWTVFNCFQYIVWGNPLEWKKALMLEAWKKAFISSEKWNLEEFWDASIIYPFPLNVERSSIIDRYNKLQNSEPSEIVEDIIFRYSLNTKANHMIVPDGDGWKETLLCDNRNQAMIRQLLLYIAYPQSAKNGCETAYCPECGAPFIRAPGESKFCEIHRSPAARQKAYRENLKRKKGNECNLKTGETEAGE